MSSAHATLWRACRSNAGYPPKELVTPLGFVRDMSGKITKVVAEYNSQDYLTDEQPEYFDYCDGAVILAEPARWN